MKVIKEKLFKTDYGFERRIQIGWSSWNDEELSVRFYYYDSRGQFCIKSPEVPLDVVISMVSYLKEDISILPESIVKMLAKL